MKTVFISILALLLIACSSSQHSSKEGSLTMTTGAIRSLDSVKATDAVSFNIISNTQETLLVSNNNKPVLGAAKSFSISPDGKVYTFKLRQGLKWSDGKALTSQDFKYAWERLIDPNVGAGYAFFLFGVKNARDYYLGKKGVKLEDVGISAPDDFTFIVELIHPTPYFSQIAAFTALAPQRKDIVEKYKESYGSKPERTIYSGPFVVSEWIKGSKLILKKNPHYYNAQNIKLENVNFMEVKEIATIYQMFNSNQLDVIAGGTGDYIKRLKQGVEKNKWKMQEKIAPSVFYIGFNFKSQKALLNKKVRLALSLATNREAYVEKIIKSDIAAYGFVPQGISVGNLNYRKEVAQPLAGQNIKDLKALLIEGLKEEGLDPNPFSHTFRFLLQKNTATAKTQGEYLKNLWEQKLGIRIKILPSADFSDFLQKLDQGEYDLSFQGWNADYDSPLTFLDLFTKDNGTNYGHYENDRVNKLIQEIQGIQDPIKRLHIFKEVERIYVLDDPAIIPIYYKKIINFEKNFVQGLQPMLFGGKYQLRWTSTLKDKG